MNGLLMESVSQKILTEKPRNIRFKEDIFRIKKSFLLLGRGRTEHAIFEGTKLQANKHNESVKQNRFVIERLIEVVCFLDSSVSMIQGCVAKSLPTVVENMKGPSIKGESDIVSLIESDDIDDPSYEHHSSEASSRKETESEGTDEDNNVHRLDWPAQSPNLNPIEHLDRQLRSREMRPTSIVQLSAMLQKEWRRIPVDILHKLVESIPDRTIAIKGSGFTNSIRPGRKVNDPTVTDLRIIKYDSKNVICYKLDFTQDFQELSTRPKAVQDEEFPRLYMERLKIKRRSDNAVEMSPGSSTKSYPAFAHIGLRENSEKNLNQERVITNLPEGAIVVFDNASYHTIQENKDPTQPTVTAKLKFRPGYRKMAHTLQKI
ncbi:hypothetical protein ANN_18950 [Periplaneta americana]|uniref:Uncharacterized protein n=1 Tax=Periplaneta americana TaxID=6978 RepID=A0ABQ8SQ56_PERAM|nr:hypothetical protein ANN_18950 [Periplaneta americana]